LNSVPNEKAMSMATIAWPAGVKVRCDWRTRGGRVRVTSARAGSGV